MGSIGRYWAVLSGIGRDWAVYWAVLGGILGGIGWYWAVVSGIGRYIGRYWVVLGGIGRYWGDCTSITDSHVFTVELGSLSAS